MHSHLRPLTRLLILLLCFGLFVFCCSSVALAADSGPQKEEDAEWVLSYAAIGLSLAGTLILLIRSSGRRDSVLSEYDRKAMRDEEVKKAKGH